MKQKITTKSDPFKNLQSYSVADVLAVGGTTAFGIKMGKDMESMRKAMNAPPKPEPFKEEE